MTAEFLAWFLKQQPFRKFRLILTGGLEYAIERPDEVDIDADGPSFHLYAIGESVLRMYRGTYMLADIEEIRQ